MSLFIDIRPEYPSTQNINVVNKKISLDDLLAFVKTNMNILKGVEADNQSSQHKQTNQINHTNNNDKNDDNNSQYDTNDSISNIVQEDIIPLQQNCSKSIDGLKDNLDIFFNKFYDNLMRIGVLKHNDNGINISLFTSIITCIKDNYKIQHTNLQQTYVKQLLANLISFVNTKFDDYDYKIYKWNKNEVVDQLKKYALTKTVMKLFSDYLHLNIFMIDLENDKLNIVDKISQFRKSIILLMIDGTNFEPLTHKGLYIFEPSNEIIKHLIATSKDIEPLIGLENEKVSVHSCGDLDKYISKGPRLSLHEKKILNTIKQSIAEPIVHVDVDDNSEQDVDYKINSNNECLSDIVDDTECINNIEDDDNIDSIDNVDDMNIDDISNIDTTEQMDMKALLKKKTYTDKTTKLNELQEDAQKLNISLYISGKKKTKAQLIVDIIKELE